VHSWLLATGSGKPLTILCLGAHADDLEIGCGATMLRLLEARPSATVCWVVCSGDTGRTREARDGAARFLAAAPAPEVITLGARDGFFPWDGGALKEAIESLKRVAPDLIFTHRLEDRHQDHRTVAELTWNAFRDHTILEYEIPKFEGDLANPNCFVPITNAQLDAKCAHLAGAYPSQRDKPWFTDETFRALARLRGVECRSPTGYAEGFHNRKLVLGF